MKQHGVTLIELMVGIAIGMLALAFGTKLHVDHLLATRKALLEARISQDLRSVGALMAREWRRAGYTAQPSAAARDTPVTVDGATSVAYDGGSTGFRLKDGVLQMRLTTSGGSSGWQPLTDPAVLRVTAFETVHRPHAVEAYRHCSCIAMHECDAAELAASPARPRILIHFVEARLRAQARADASIEREIRESAAVRAQQVEGQCP